MTKDDPTSPRLLVQTFLCPAMLQIRKNRSTRSQPLVLRICRLVFCLQTILLIKSCREHRDVKHSPSANLSARAEANGERVLSGAGLAERVPVRDVPCGLERPHLLSAAHPRQGALQARWALRLLRYFYHCPHSGWPTFIQLTFWACGTNPSTLGRKRARTDQIGEPK